jgi:hypothetical protein
MMGTERRFSFFMIGMLVMSVFMVGGVLGQGADERVAVPFKRVPVSDATANSPLLDLSSNERESNVIFIPLESSRETSPGIFTPLSPILSPSEQLMEMINNNRLDSQLNQREEFRRTLDINQLPFDTSEFNLKDTKIESSDGVQNTDPLEYDEGSTGTESTNEQKPASDTSGVTGNPGDDSVNLNPDGTSDSNPSHPGPDGNPLFPKSECVEKEEDAPAYDADIFLKGLGAKSADGPPEENTEDAVLIPKLIKKKGEKFVLVDGEFKPEQAIKDDTYLAQVNAFNALEGKDKNEAWDQLSDTPELKKRFLQTLQEKYYGEGEEKAFKMFDDMKAEDLPDIDWAEGGQMRVGAKEGKGGVLVDLCAIEKYNSEDNLGKDFKYNLEGGEYSAKPSRLLGIDSVTNPETDKKELRYTFANGAFMDIAGSEADGGRMYDLENRKLMIKDKDEGSGVSASWMNNRGRVRVDESGALKVGMTNGADGKFNTEGLDFAIMEVGEGDNKRIISPYQRRIDAFPGGEEITKPTGSGSNVFRRVGDEVFSINKDGQAFQVGEGSYQLVGDEEHFEYSYAEISGEGGQEKGQFFFGAERRDKDGKRLGLNNFALRTSEDGKVSDVNLFGNVLYEQTGDMGNIIMGEGDQRMVNGDFVISRNEKGELETRSLTGKKGGKLSHKGDVFTEYGDENSPEVDRLKLEDAAVGERLVKEVVTEEVKEEIPGRKDTTKGDVGTLSGGGGISDPDLKKAYDTSIAAYGGFSKLSNNENENGIYALAFTATWCGPCNSMKTNIGNGNSISGSIVNVDTDIHGGLTQRYAITELPTVVYINSLTGMEVGRRINPSQNTVTILNNEFKKTS